MANPAEDEDSEDDAGEMITAETLQALEEK